jgi:phosphoribosylformimino-5-aminoimidazole carboxamide ribotide isomerase
MIAIPAIDLRDGACVQLVGGSYSDERVRLPDPVLVARRWAECGFSQLHVVDLDAAIGVGSNDVIIDALLRETNVEIQVGGGVRSTERIEQLLCAGAKRVVVGTRALEEREWLAVQAERFPGSIVVAADVRDNRLTVRGWTSTLAGSIEGVIRELSSLPLAGILVTAVDVEGQMKGPALPLIANVVEASRVPIIASGGVTTIEDLRALGAMGVSAAVIGMALYTGILDARSVAQEFGV